MEGLGGVIFAEMIAGKKNFLTFELHYCALFLRALRRLFGKTLLIFGGIPPFCLDECQSLLYTFIYRPLLGVVSGV